MRDRVGVVRSVILPRACRAHVAARATALTLMTALAMSPLTAQRVRMYALLAVPCDSAAAVQALSRWSPQVTAYSCPSGSLFGTVAFSVRWDSVPTRSARDSVLARRRSSGVPILTAIEPDASTGVEENEDDVDGGLAASSWGRDTLRVAGAYALGVDGAGVRVGIIDTGYWLDHPEIAGRVAGCRTFVATPRDGCEQPGTACRSHGQHVASTVAGATVGVAPGATIYAAQVYAISGGECVNYASSRIAALNWLVTEGVTAINISTGGSGNLAEMFAVTAAHGAGVTVCASAGNEGPSHPVYSPARFADALGIGALASNLTPASYSNADSTLDFAFPGSGITGAMGESGYGSKSGTSMAAPHCTGLVALIRQVVPGVPADSVVSILRASARDLLTPGRDDRTGWGMPRADRAVALALGLSLQPTSTAGTVRVARGASGCWPVSSPAAWTVHGGTGLTLTPDACGLRYQVAAEAPLGVQSLTLVAVP